MSLPVNYTHTHTHTHKHMENTLFYFMIDLIGPVILIGICDVHVPFYFKNRIDVIAEIIYIYYNLEIWHAEMF
jgi:hypothetical protein